MEQTPSHWEKCRTCGKAIGFSSKYWTCSVSSCNRKSNPIIFCSVDCWDVHVPVMNHKSAGAEENFSPNRPSSFPSSPSSTPEKSQPRRILISSSPSSGKEAAHSTNSSPAEREILIVASKLKDYIRKQSGGFNTSASVLDRLSDIVRNLCDEAIHKTRRDGRKTVMDKDF